MAEADPTIEAFCQALPKLELHAHLGGSLPDTLVAELMARKGLPQRQALMTELHIGAGGQRTMAECFKLFDIIHKVTDSLDVIRRATQSVVEAYARDNCVYLELRSTPRRLDCLGQTDYLEAMLDGIAAARHAGLAPETRILLSVNRTKPLADAEVPNFRISGLTCIKY